MKSILEINPKVIRRTSDGEDTYHETLTGEFCRCYPENQKDVFFLASLELGIDKYAPYSGDGIIVDPKFIIQGRDRAKVTLDLKYPVYTVREAWERKYKAYTAPISVDKEPHIIMSMQSGMGDKDVCWISQKTASGRLTHLSMAKKIA